jgi:(R,R)-butanediol dehydrogenase / meso-butanediol dehydrogenase / diacetyl reductase
MKAVVLHGAGDLRVDNVPEPGDIGRDQLRVRSLLCGVCGTDLHEYEQPKLVTATNHPLTGTSLPQILGHEFSAEVLEIGADVTAAAVGDRVAIMPLIFCGQCAPCRAGTQQLCQRLGAVGYNWPWGGMGEYAIVAEHQVAVLPDEFSNEQGALVEPTAVALEAVNRAPVHAGDVVFVTGGGPIGQLVALAALAAGAGAVLLSEPNPVRRQRAERLGVAAIDPTTEDAVEAVRAYVSDGVDVAIEASGVGPALEACIGAVRNGGTVIQTGVHTRAMQFSPRTLMKDISLRGVVCFSVDSWPRVIRLMASGRLPSERVITGQVPIDQGVEAFDRLLDPAGDGVKVLLGAR